MVFVLLLSFDFISLTILSSYFNNVFFYILLFNINLLLFDILEQLNINLIMD